MITFQRSFTYSAKTDSSTCLSSPRTRL